ncbi:hypothetical protein F5B19DRAFT_269549 [Rostrohypoxylon terebratum]|nr:hypothetical protein F5B19DRAFT_269549 [Rostrohypoxylon terebratum]
MASRRAMNITSAGCSHCHFAVLKLFTSPASVNALSTVRARPLQSRARLIPAVPIRSFSSQSPQSEPLDGSETTQKGEGSDGADSQGHDIATEGSSLTSIPWYLQVEPPRHVASIKPPPLPEVPTGSPEIVGALLKHLSEKSGFNDLSLLDLRGLSRPAALGPNLFMLFGTARSERHLHVSAAHLQRWLRFNYKVNARADGLLGPNERKTKLRRRARRAKLLGGPQDDADDGMSTGWICVNLGTLNFGNHEDPVYTSDGRFSGFGVPQTGYTVVVQLMTEPQRAQMGLEALWEKALSKSIDASSKLEAEAEAEAGDVNNIHPLEEAASSSSRRLAAYRPGKFNDTLYKEQKRTYSTRQVAAHDASRYEPLFALDSREALEHALQVDVRQKYRILDLLIYRLSEMSVADQRKALGISQEGVSPFIRLSESACQSLHPHKTWWFRLAVLATACRSSIGHPFELLDNVESLIEEMTLYGIEATRDQYLQLLTCIYSSSGGHDQQHTLAEQVLRMMQQRGEPTIAHDVIVTVIETMCRYHQQPVWDDYYRLIKRLEDALSHLNLPCMDEPLLMRLMTSFYQIQHWTGFWTAWRMRPTYSLPRSATMYTHFYQLMASSGSWSTCALGIRRTFQGLLAENPSVLPNKQVIESLMNCIRIADPFAEEVANRMENPDREMVKIIHILKLTEMSAGSR